MCFSFPYDPRTVPLSGAKQLKFSAQKGKDRESSIRKLVAIALHMSSLSQLHCGSRSRIPGFAVLRVCLPAHTPCDATLGVHQSAQ